MELRIIICGKSSLEGWLRSIRGVFREMNSKGFWRKLTFLFLLLTQTTFAQQSANEILSTANLLYNKGRYAQAMLMYDKAESRGADKIVTNFNTANCLFRLEKFPEAAAAYRKSIDYSKGEFAPAMFNLAAVLYRIGQYSESIAAYHRALRIDEENISAWLYLAESYQKTGDRIGALRALENAARLDSEDISVAYQLAEIHISLNEFDAAIALIRKAYIQNPAESDYLIYIGDIYRMNKEYEYSAGAYREALTVVPDNVELLYKLADVLAEDNKPFLAINILNQALQIEPSFSDAAIFLGNLAFDANWKDRAEQAYLQAGKYGNAEAVQGLRNLAYDAEQKNQISKAINYLEKALNIAPNDISLRAEIEIYGSR